MKICAVQIKPIQGDIQGNIKSHKRLIELATGDGVDTIIFPELSITSYEPELAKELATHQDDSRFDDFQKIADLRRITIGIGVPTRNELGVCISMVIFQPQEPRQTYSKKYIHPDEEDFFVCGQNSTGLIGNQANIAPAICYELSVPEHSENAFRNGAKIYLASVAKSASGVEKAVETLSEIACKYSMTVLMANCLGRCDDFEGAGKTAAWNHQGLLIGQLNGKDEGILIVDTDTQQVTEKII